jgi:hypothetical protein
MNYGHIDGMAKPITEPESERNIFHVLEVVTQTCTAFFLKVIVPELVKILYF